jgi:hypothetical protein
MNRQGHTEPGRETARLCSQFGRVRTLTKHGMTQAQVADLYEVPIDEILPQLRRRRDS